MSKIRVVGLDCAFVNLGIARGVLDIDTLEFKVDDLRLVKTQKSKDKKVRVADDNMNRAQILNRAIHEACEGYDLAFAEIPTGTQSAKAATALGIALGIIACCPLKVIGVTPTQPKVAAVGHKTATKGEMIHWASTKWPDAPWKKRKLHGRMVLTEANEHLADALAVIKAGSESLEFRKWKEGVTDV